MSNTRLQLIVVGSGIGLTVVLYWLLELDHGFPSWSRLPIGIAIDALVDATVEAVPWLFSGIGSAVVAGVNYAEHVLVATSPLVIAAVAVIVVARLASVGLAVYTLAGLTFIGATGLWKATMETAALMIVALVFAIFLGLVIGLLAARSDRFTQFLRPALDAMQSCPSFVYFIPFLIIFGVGAPSAILITIIYSMPPIIRLTNFGLRRVPREAVEAAQAFGANRTQILRKVELPLAKPSIMLGVNQTVMLALSVVVMAGMIGAGGLGIEVWRSVQNLRFGRGLEAGLCIVFIAIVFDRLGYALSQPRRAAVSPDARSSIRPPSGGARQTMSATVRSHIRRLARWIRSRSAMPYPVMLRAVALIVMAAATALALPRHGGDATGVLAFSVDGPVNDAVRWFNVNVAPHIHPARDFLIRNILLPFVRFLVWVPWPVAALVAGWLALRRSGWRACVGAVAAVLSIGALGMWEHTMTTLAIVAIAVAISVTLGVTIGILMTKSDMFEATIRAVLDVLQTLPIFIFVIPAVMFMGVGIVAGILATVIYAMPPVIRLTNLGLRQVNVEMVEAARAFGATERQVLWKVKIASARPTIMLGVSQTTLLALAMVVVSAMIGTIGLGERVMWAVGGLKLPLGFEAGASIIILAMLLDRIFQGRGGGEGVRLG